MYFSSTRGPEPAIYRRPIDLSSRAEQVWVPGGQSVIIVDSASADGRFLFATVFGDGALPQGWVLRLDDPLTAESLLGGGFYGHAQIHPSDRWIAFVRDTAGQAGVFFAEFPVGRIWQISSGVGQEPMWARDGKRLFYRSGARMMVVDVQTEPDFQPVAPRAYMSEFAAPEDPWITGSAYDVASDGRPLTTIGAPDVYAGDASPRIRVVVNWFNELKRLVPTDP